MGLARELVTFAIRRAREAGCYKLGLMSDMVRPDAHHFYESLGFDRYAWGYRLEL